MIRRIVADPFSLWTEPRVFVGAVNVLLCSYEGMRLNNRLLQLISLRFADDAYEIDFDDYLTCIVRLENMFSTYGEHRSVKPSM